MKRLIPKQFLAIFAALALAGAANAAIITFSGTDPGANARPIPNSDASAASFDTAASSIAPETIITFESAPLGTFTNLLIAPGVTISGTDYLGGLQSISVTPTCDVALCGGNTTVAGSHFLYVNAGTLTFTFTTPISYFGAYLAGVQLDGETVTFNDGASQTLIIPNPSSGGGIQFFGFTDAGKTFTSLTFHTPNPGNELGDFISIDDVRVQTADVAGTPEPGTFVLGAVGLALLAAGLRRKRA